MGGAKKKSPAQQEKSQMDEATKTSGAKKKGKKQEKSEGSKSEISVIVNEEQASKFIKSAKVLTVQELSRQTGVKISAANSYLKKLLATGTVKRIGGYSGHHIYQPVTG
jgi:small subunit ribosomal protein S25e